MGRSHSSRGRPLVLGLLCVVVLAAAACGPEPAPSRSLAAAGGSGASAGAGGTTCTTTPAAGGQVVHSAALGLSVTLPKGWHENSSSEGGGGSPGLDVGDGSATPGIGANGTDVQVSALPSSMTPDQVVEQEKGLPGTGHVIATAQCTIGGDPAAYLVTAMPSIPMYGQQISLGGGYDLYLSHGGRLYRFLIMVPSATPALPADVQELLGSVTWG